MNGGEVQKHTRISHINKQIHTTIMDGDSRIFYLTLLLLAALCSTSL